MSVSAETFAIAYGHDVSRPRLQRPRLQHCFNTWIDNAFSEDESNLILRAMVAMIGCTGGDVGFEKPLYPVDRFDLRVIKDGSRDVPGGYAGVAYVQADADDVVVFAEIVLHPLWIRSKVVMHELGHVLGFCHPGDVCPQSVMAKMPIDSLEPDEADRIAWKWMASVRPGFRNPAVPDSVASALRRERRTQEFICS